jgi:AcrR family transcriptional regulator
MPVTTPSKTTREPLDTAKIVAAGIELADEQGVGALTMRHLAERLGFKVMALYNHVANKDELLALMVDAVAATIELPSTDEGAMGVVRAHAIATRAAFVRHPWVPGLWQQYLPGPNRIDHMEHLLATLNNSGLPADIAHHGFHAVNNHVLGYTLQELAMGFDAGDADAPATIEGFLASLSTDTHPHTLAHVHQHLDGDTASSFELVLDLILDGLAALPEDRSRPCD